MLSPAHLPLLSLLALSPLAALARTDLSGCTTFTSTVTVNPTAHEYGNVYKSLVYYDPDTLEICTVPDCGGGRAPRRTGVPGCPLYSGTATPTPSFLSADPLAPPAAATTTTTSTSGSGSNVAAGTTITSAASEATGSSSPGYGELDSRGGELDGGGDGDS
ncbi:putative siderophore biosynthesis [Diaporthe ampelina]|uniref:Putative siderophore biosynthesis n=1 Tax=Diaporthe ampelina TaxID=1214573 RepID=A0A0G2IGH0_9PEZI|nr:putative siderophore biosynthesis [Diaporthe ampelina]